MSDPIPMRHLQGGWVVLHGKCKHCGELIMRFRFKEGQQWWHTDFATGKDLPPLHKNGPSERGAVGPTVRRRRRGYVKTITDLTAHRCVCGNAWSYE